METYSSKLIGKIRNHYNGSRLILVGSECDGQPVKARHFAEASLPNSGFLANLSPSEVGAFNVRMPGLVEKMIGAQPTLVRDAYLSGIGGCDIDSLPQIAAHLVKDKSYKAVMRLVYGATAQMPLRAISYCLPPLTLMNALLPHLEHDQIQLQVISAHHLSSGLNGLEIAAARSQAFDAFNLMRRLVDSQFPGLKESVTFVHDRPASSNKGVASELGALSSLVVDKASQSMNQSLAKKAENNGGIEAYGHYGAAHLLVHDSVFNEGLEPFDSKEPSLVKPDAIISIGGGQERDFYRLRHELKRYLSDEYNRLPTMQYFTRHSVPPYYMARGGDVPLQEIGSDNKNREITKAAACDLDYLNLIVNLKQLMKGSSK